MKKIGILMTFFWTLFSQPFTLAQEQWFDSSGNTHNVNDIVSQVTKDDTQFKKLKLLPEFENNKADIFFDLHGVLVKSNWWNGISQIGSTVQGFDKVKLLGQAIGALLSPECHKCVWNLGFRLPFSKKTPEGKNKIMESYFNIAEKCGYKLLYKELTQFANNFFVTNEKMLPVLASLKKNGHKLHLFSNIGPRILQDAEQRNLFDDILEYFPNKNTINKTQEQTYDTWKPHGRAYQEALKSADTYAKNSIMVEDKCSNLPTEEGIKLAQTKANKKGHNYLAPEQWAAGIVYHSKKHPAFITQLKILGLLPNNFTIQN